MMTADQIERIVEWKIDAINSAFLARKMTQAEYDCRMKEVHKWADRQYEAMKR